MGSGKKFLSYRIIKEVERWSETGMNSQETYFEIMLKLQGQEPKLIRIVLMGEEGVRTSYIGSLLQIPINL